MSVDRQTLDAAAQRAVARLSSVVRAATMYPLTHPSMRFALEGFAEALTEIHAQASPVEIRLHEDVILVGSTGIRPSRSVKTALGALVPLLQSLEIGGLSLKGPPTIEDCVVVAQMLIEGLTEDDSGVAEGTGDWLLERGVESIGTVPLDQQQDRDWHALTIPPPTLALSTYLQAIRAVQQLYEHGLEPGVVVLLTRAGQGIVDIVMTWPDHAALLVSPRAELPYEVRHPVHVALLSALLGQRIGLDRGEMLDLALCAFAIDCGMATIPESIRKRQGPLPENERALVEAHPIESVKALLGAPQLTPGVRRRVRVAFESHIGVDTTGYPDTLRWPAVHLYSRIVALADGYDALRADTPYRESMTQQMALTMLRQHANKRYDPDLLGVLETLIHELQARLDRADQHAT